MIDTLGNILIGLISGICTGIGLGGGSVLILSLVFFFNFDQHIAQATNILFFIPTALSAILINIKSKNINFKLSISIILFGIIGSVIGAFISSKLNVKDLRKLFGLFLLFISICEFYSLIRQYIKDKILYCLRLLELTHHL